jgi:hypothetical protein
MWRVLLVGLLVGGCSDPAPANTDAAVVPDVHAWPIYRTAPFTMLICTGGNPGDANCPINVVSLDAFGDVASGAQLRFVAQPLSQDLYLTDIRVMGNSRVHIVGLYLEQWDGSMATATVLLTEQLDPGQTVGPTAAMTILNPASQVVVRAEVVY